MFAAQAPLDVARAIRLLGYANNPSGAKDRAAHAD